jgi:hypothetical protein
VVSWLLGVFASAGFGICPGDFEKPADADGCNSWVLRARISASMSGSLEDVIS